MNKILALHFLINLVFLTNVIFEEEDCHFDERFVDVQRRFIHDLFSYFKKVLDLDLFIIIDFIF